MRVCRFENQGEPQAAFFFDDEVVPVASAAEAYNAEGNTSPPLPDTTNLLAFLPGGEAAETAHAIYHWLEGEGAAARHQLRVQDAKLLVPQPRPNKLFLLAGNYAKHIEEGGGVAAERAETFPYVFMKPPTTTLTHPDGVVRIPANSPNYIDWELELAILIGKEAKHVREADALNYVAGYTIINDISNRKFRPNPSRKERDKDGFFDWLHGKWHDSFCPCGPCIASSATIQNPQRLAMKLRVNDDVKQDASTAQMVFPVAAVVEFVSNIVTLEPGDIISTGTPAGVGAAKGEFLRPGDSIEAEIDGIGVLRSSVDASASA